MNTINTIYSIAACTTGALLFIIYELLSRLWERLRYSTIPTPKRNALAIIVSFLLAVVVAAIIYSVIRYTIANQLP